MEVLAGCGVVEAELLGVEGLAFESLQRRPDRLGQSLPPLHHKPQTGVAEGLWMHDFRPNCCPRC